MFFYCSSVLLDSCMLINTLVNNKIKNKTWIDEISNLMKRRDVVFSNHDFDACTITRNKTIMSCAADYVTEKSLKKEVLAPIN